MGGPGSGRWPKKEPGTHLGARSPRQQEADRIALAAKRELPVPAPPGRSTWNPVAAAWYRSLGLTAFAHKYQQSDWALAWIGADLLTYMYDTRFTPGLLQEFTRLSARLGCAVGDRGEVLSLTALPPGERETDPDEQEAQASVTDLRSRLRAVDDLPGI